MGYSGLGQEHAEAPAPAPAPAPMPSAPAPASQPVDTQFVPTMRTLPEKIAVRPEPWRSRDLFTRPRSEARSFAPVSTGPTAEELEFRRRWQPRPEARSFAPVSTGPTAEELEAEERAREFAEWQAQQQANLLQPHGQLPIEEQVRIVEEERAKALKDLWKNAPLPHGQLPVVEAETSAIPTQPWRSERPMDTIPVSQPWRSQDLFTRRWQPRPEPRSFVPAREIAEWQEQQAEAAAEERAKALKDLWNAPLPHGQLPTVEAETSAIPTYRTIQEAERARGERAIPVETMMPISDLLSPSKYAEVSTTPTSSVTHNADGSVTDAAGVTWFWGPSGWEIQERDGRSAPSWYKKETPTPILPPAPVPPESIWTQRGEISGGGKFTIRSGSELDNPKTLSEIRIDDALASAQWYDLYGRTPPERGGATPGEHGDVQRWRAIAFERYYELKSKGHTLSPYWSAFGDFIDGLLANPLTYAAAFPIVPLLFLAKSCAEAPQTIDEAQERAKLRTENMIDGGYNPYGAGFLAFVMGMGDLLPSNKYTEAIIGYDLTTGRELTDKERAWRAAMAVVETGLWAIGASKGKSFRLWTLPERAPITTVATDFTIKGPKGPMPVLNPVAAPAPTGYRHLTTAEKALLRDGLEKGITEITPEMIHTAEGSFIREGFRVTYRSAAASGYGSSKIVTEPGIPDFKSGDWVYGYGFLNNNKWHKYSAGSEGKNWATEFRPVTDAEVAAAYKAVTAPAVPMVPSIRRPPGYKAPAVQEPFTMPADPAEGGGQWIYKYIQGQGWVRQLKTPGGIPGIQRPVLIGPVAPKRPPSSMQFESGDFFYSLVKDKWWKFPKSGLEPGGGGGVASGEWVTLEQATAAARAGGADDVIIKKMISMWEKAGGATWEPIFHPSPTAEPFHPIKATDEFLNQIVEHPPQELYKDWLAKWAKIFTSPQFGWSTADPGEAGHLVLKKLPWNLPTPLRGMRLKGITKA